MKNAKMTICLMTAVLVTATGQGFGLTQYKDGGTHNISSTINDDVWVDYLTPGMQTKVNLLDGGYISYYLQGFNDSRINISGGSARDLWVHDSSQVTMSGGSVNSGRFIAYDSSNVTISGGSVKNFDAYNNSLITINDGLLNGLSGLNAYNNSRITINGGLVEYSSRYYDSSQVTMSGGHTNDLYAYNNTHVTINGGSLSGRLYAYDSSQVTISSGSMGSFMASGSVEWSGGTIEGDLSIYGLSTMTIYGSNFAIDGIPFGFGEIKGILGGSYVYEPFRTLTGTLANGDIINNQFRIGDTAKIVLIPEPASLLLLGLGGLLIQYRK